VKYGHVPKECGYNKRKQVAKDNDDDDDEAKMPQEDSDGEPLVLMTIILDNYSYS